MIILKYFARKTDIIESKKILIRGNMLGPIGSQIMSIFRLLSPDEIDKYIVREEEAKVNESLPMASGGEEFASEGHQEDQVSQRSAKQETEFPKEHQAEIIPLHKLKVEEVKQEPETALRQQEKKHSQHSSLSGESGELESLGILSAKSIRAIEEERLKKENAKKDSATVFLLKEREKLKSSKKRLIEQVAFKSYQSNAAQEFHDMNDDDLLEEENSSKDLKGILLNKRHY